MLLIQRVWRLVPILCSSRSERIGLSQLSILNAQAITCFLLTHGLVAHRSLRPRDALDAAPFLGRGAEAGAGTGQAF